MSAPSTDHVRRAAGAWIAEASAGGRGTGEVRLLSRSDVRRCLAEVDVVDVVRVTLARHDRGHCVLPDEGYLPWRNAEGAYSRSIAMPGAVAPPDAPPAYGLKVINASVSNPSHGLERAGGVGLCMDPETARVTTIMEVGLLSALRTAAVTAVGVEACGFGGAESLAVVGCGMQGRTHLLLLLERLTGIRRVSLYDRDPARAAALAATVSLHAPDVVVDVAESVEAAVAGTRVVVTTTTSDVGYLGPGPIGPDALVAHVSLADLTDEAILAAGAVYVDDVDLVAANPRRPLGRLMVEGRLHAPADGPRDGRNRIDATVGGLVSGRSRPVRDPAGFVLLNPFGMGVLDVALLDAVRAGAERSDVGTVVSFE